MVPGCSGRLTPLLGSPFCPTAFGLLTVWLGTCSKVFSALAFIDYIVRGLWLPQHALQAVHWLVCSFPPAWEGAVLQSRSM